MRVRAGALALAVALTATLGLNGALGANGGRIGMTAHAQAVGPGRRTPKSIGLMPKVLPTATGIALFIGAGTTTSSGRPTLVTSLDGFQREVSSPSPMLRSALHAYFDQGGLTAWVLTTPTEDAAAFAAALASITPTRPVPAGTDWDLIVLPALGSLAIPDWLTVARAATAAAAADEAIALLDPPDAAVAAVATAGAAPLIRVAQQITRSISSPSSAVLISSGLSDQGAPVSGAAVLAGITAETDQSVGPWMGPAGFDHPVFDDYTPELVVDDDLANAFVGASIDSWRVIPGTGTIMLGSHTLSRRRTAEYISQARTALWIERSIATALPPFVFAANDAVTWSTVVEMISKFLTTLWGDGALIGPKAPDSFTVAAGLGSTMTAQDILNGVLRISVGVLVDNYGAPVSLQFTQSIGP